MWRHKYRPRWRALVWRLGHVRRRGAEAAARGLLHLVIRAPRRLRLPRRLVAAVERVLFAAADDTLFDRTLYLERNPDVRAAGADPLAHYLRHGWAEGRCPNGWFDEARYRRQAGLTRCDTVSALAHYLARGRARGLGPKPKPGQGPRAARRVLAGATLRLAGEADDEAAALALARLERIAPRGNGPDTGAAQVDVIVPVYRGRAETLGCLASVLEAGNRTRFALVVVDDAGPDARLRADLALLARRGLIELMVQPRNLGFVVAVNAGMRRNRDRDVVWLNADTEVGGDWLDRLRRAAWSAPDVATVTPLTNNGTICSYPRFNTDNCEPLEVDWAELDRIAARVNAGQSVEAPTCVGFATYVRRDALEAVGMLDQAAFGRGYGEENDFSQRAIRMGWRNLIAGDVFVRHLGQTSFGDERAGRVAAAMRVVERRHPGYGRAVARFIAADPVAPLRRAIDLERLRSRLRRRRNVLIVTHSLGGGTRQHVGEEIARLTAGGAGVVLMSGGAAGPDAVRLSHPELAELPSLEAVGLGGRELVELLGTLGITEVRLHHLADFGRDAARRFIWLIDALGLPMEFSVHDYLAVCPRINLADHSGMYCGEPGEAGCRRCLMRRRSGFGAPDIRRWRRDYAALLATARVVRVPDRDVAARLRRYFPRLGNIVVRPHERPRGAAPSPRPAGRRPGPLRIAAIGAIGPIKGFDVLLDLAAQIRSGIHAGGGAAELTVIGYTRNDAAARAAGIEVTGPYRNDRAGAAIERVDPDLILIPSIWPETYCYTLSHALASGRPVAGFDLGAVGTRLRDAGRSGARCSVLPLALARDPSALLDALAGAAGVGEAVRPAPRRMVAVAR
ncbi:MAG: glycosyltransferase [Alphaproteobacteria bacterium]